MITALFVALTMAPAATRGDFDHDGRPDRVSVVKRAEDYVLSVRRGAAPETPVMLYRIGQRADFFVDRATAGRRPTACGKGLGSNAYPCPRKYVALKGDTISFGVRESTEAVAYWNGRRFEVVWLSD